MIRPRPRQPSYLRQASEARQWVRAIAEREQRSARAVAHDYRTMRQLGRACAVILRDYCNAEAIRLVREDAVAPDGADLLDRTIARYHARYAALKDAYDRDAQHATAQLVLLLQGA